MVTAVLLVNNAIVMRFVIVVLIITVIALQVHPCTYGTKQLSLEIACPGLR